MALNITALDAVDNVMQSVVMLSVANKFIMLKVNIPSVAILNVIMPTVVAPLIVGSRLRNHVNTHLFKNILIETIFTKKN